jgi:hypothetical protein
MNPNVILHVLPRGSFEGWTWENFTRYVEYESMFFGTANRVLPRTAPGGDRQADASFALYRSSQGYNGFTLEHSEYIYLYNVDGTIPPVGGPRCSGCGYQYGHRLGCPTQGG